MLLSPLINGSTGSHQPLLILRSSVAQSSVPILRYILSKKLDPDKAAFHYTLLFCFTNHPTNLVEDGAASSEYLEVHNWTDNIPGYNETWFDPREHILLAVQKKPSGSLHLIIDSVDALLSDVGSISETYKFLHELLVLIKGRPDPSRLVFQVLQGSRLLPLLIQPAFSPSLVYLVTYPPILLSYLAKDYLTSPPPASPAAKFWAVFLPLSARSREIDYLVYGPDGEGSSGTTEIVVEILLREGSGSGRKRTVERVLEGWTLRDGPCDLSNLDSLKGMFAKKIKETASDPTHDVSFNLNLTSSQKESRARVPLPYAYESNPLLKQPSISPAILYDPDSGDDIDDDDPDEDLDI